MLEIVVFCSIIIFKGDDSMHKVDLFVIEDEKSICEEYKERVKNYPEINYLGSTGNSEKALQMCKELNPGALVLDLELQQGSGNGLDFLTKLKKLNLPTKPYIIVVTNIISPTTHKIARQLGTDFVITKSQKDYNVKMVLDLFKTYNDVGFGLDNDEMFEGNAKMEAAIAYREKLKNKITEELDLIGISPRVKGRKYLRDAIEMTCDKERANLSTLIAKKYSVSTASVERAMQGAINRAWNSTDTETLEKQYTAYINPKRSVPTLMEFVYFYADKVKSNI